MSKATNETLRLKADHLCYVQTGMEGLRIRSGMQRAYGKGYRDQYDAEVKQQPSPERVTSGGRVPVYVAGKGEPPNLTPEQRAELWKQYNEEVKRRASFWQNLHGEQRVREILSLKKIYRDKGLTDLY